MLPAERALVESLAGEHTEAVWPVIVGTVISQNTDLSNLTNR